jgi:hypothetical protein
LAFSLDNRNTHEAVGVQGLFGLRANIRDQEGLLFPVRWTTGPPGYDLRLVRANRATQINRAGFSQPNRTPFFMHTPASGDDGSSSQPERVTTGYPDTGESGDTYNAEMAYQPPHRGVIDHVSGESPVVYAYWFERRPAIKWCYFCQGSKQRHRTHWCIVKDSYRQRVCRRCMIRTGVYRAFLTWLVNPW